MDYKTLRNFADRIAIDLTEILPGTILVNEERHHRNHYIPGNKEKSVNPDTNFPDVVLVFGIGSFPVPLDLADRRQTQRVPTTPIFAFSEPYTLQPAKVMDVYYLKPELRPRIEPLTKIFGESHKIERFVEPHIERYITGADPEVNEENSRIVNEERKRKRTPEEIERNKKEARELFEKSGRKPPF